MKKYIVLILSVFMLTACKDEISILNHWKLVSIEENNQKTTIRCENCFEFYFQDGKISGNTENNTLNGEFSFNEEKKEVSIQNLMMTRAFETPEGNLVATNLKNVHFYKIENQTLKLYFKNNQNIEGVFSFVLKK